MHIMASLPHFQTPWFICTMATGISTSILYNYPYPAQWLRNVSYIMFALCSASLIITAVLFACEMGRSHQYRYNVVFDIRYNVFVSCGVMGFTSWVTAMHLVTEHRVPLLSYVLWWISNLLSLVMGWIMFLCIVWKSKIKFHKITATLLLPIVALTVTASLGGVIAPSLPHSLRQSTIIVSFLLWSNAIGLAFIILTVYIHRLIEHKFPAKQHIFTSFIPIGFMGQGAFAIQLFGKDYHDHILSISTDLSTQIQADIFQYTSVLAGLFLEGMGICFTFIAIWAVVSKGTQQFHHGFWATTFPLGTMSLATHQTGIIMDWQAFLVVSCIYGTFVVLFTTFCMLMSLRELVQWMLNTQTTQEQPGKTCNDTSSQSEAEV